MYSIGPDDSLLTLNGLDLMASASDGSYTLEALGSDSGMDFGSPQGVTATMQSFLQDGSLSATTRHDNRTLVMVVRIKADDAVGLAAGEAALTAACITTWGTNGQIVPLAWTPPAGLDAPTSVFDVVGADFATQNWSDYDELVPDAHGILYKLTLDCLPWAKSATDVTLSIPAPTASSPVTPTITSVDACGATTGWSAVSSGTATGTPTVTASTDTGRGSYVKAVGALIRTSPNAANGGLIFTRSFSSAVNMAATPYLIVSCGAFWQSNGANIGSAGIDSLRFYINGNRVYPVAQSGTKYYLNFAGSMSKLDVAASGTVTGPGDALQVWVSDVSREDMLSGGTATQKQVSQQFEMQGSVRTPASIGIQGTDVASGNPAALGQVLVHTSRAGAGPVALMQYCDGSPTTDATAYSNESIDLTSSVLFDAPYGAFQQSGYLLVARVKSATAGTKTGAFAVRTMFGGSVRGPVLNYTCTFTIAAPNTCRS